jgi:hypothetical protein
MDTRNKLKETRYFLDALNLARNEPEKFQYNLSAFLNAWRSILDVMLYDFAEFYSLGFTREEKVTDRDFWVAARAKNLNDAMRFIEWWREKQGVLMNNPLWRKRTITAHRGYPQVAPYRFYVSGSGGTSITISGDVVLSAGSAESAIPVTITPLSELRFTDFPDQSITDLCTRAFSEIERIIQEAEREFHVQL